MANQSEFLKYKDVMEVIIEPMITIYQTPHHLRDNQEAYKAALGEYKNMLCRYSRNGLSKGWALVKADHKTWTWPHYHSIAEQCSKFDSVLIVEQQEAKQKSSKDNHFNFTLAEAVMRSPIGQKALSMGVGQSLWMKTWRDGKSDFTEAEVQKIKSEWEDGLRQLMNIGESDFMYPRLKSFADEIIAKEQEFYRKYYRVAA